MASTGIANTPLINYFFYKQSTSISSASIPCCNVFTSVADGGNGQLVVTTPSTYISLLSVGVAITISGTVNYDGNYSIISLDTVAGTFNISGTFVGTEAGTWELASNTDGANAGDPLDYGVITFYDNDDQVTLQDTYADRELTVTNPNPITLDALGSYPPIYLLDNPYYIVIRDKFNNLVATLENYLPGGENGGNTGAEIANLFSNYGFDTQINSNLYEENTIAPNTAVAVSAGWRWEIQTTQTDAVNTYSYQVISDQALLANPKNAIRLTSTNKTGGETVNRFTSVLGDYNKYQGLQLGFSIYANFISGSAQDFTCQLIRSRAGAPQTPIDIGAISVNFTQTQLTFLFTVPYLTDANYANDDTLTFVINFPLNEDFVLDLTGTWLQISADGVISPSEEAGSVTAGKEFFGESFRELQSPTQYISRGLPVAINAGFAATLNQTGTIFLASVGSSFNYAVSMGKKIANYDDNMGVELLRDNVLEMTQTNRLIDYLRDNDLTQSRHTFVTSVTTNAITVGTGIGVAPLSTWTSLATPRITVSLDTEEFIYKLKAYALGNGKVEFVFVDNFATNPNSYNPPYSGGGAGNLIQGGTLDPGPLINWFVEFNFINNSILAPGAGGQLCAFTYFLHTSTVSTGSTTTPAIMHLWCVDASSRARKVLEYKLSGGVSSTFYLQNWTQHQINSVYDNTVLNRVVEDTGGASPSVTYHSHFFGYNDVSNNPATQGVNPPRVLRFSVDGHAPNGPTGLTTTATIDLFSGDSKEVVAAKIVVQLNTSFSNTITIVDTPNNGDIVQICNGQTNFNLIFWDTDQTKPSNPDTRVPIYVEYTTAQTTDDIALSAQTAIEYAVMGVPLAADLGLSFGTETTAESSLLEYYMMI